MIQRCNNPKTVQYKDYGGRGIFVCERWLNFNLFLLDMRNGYNDSLQIDRIDNNDGYYLENCRWVTGKQNNRNKRSVKLNMEKAIEIRNSNLRQKTLAEMYGISKTVIFKIKHGLIWT